MGGTNGNKKRAIGGRSELGRINVSRAIFYLLPETPFLDLQILNLVLLNTYDISVYLIV